MQNSEAVQAWIQGKMATFRILVLVSKTEIRSREFSFSSRSLRMKIINLDLVSMPEIGGDFFSVSSRSLRLSVRNSRSRLDVRDWIRETLILVSRMKKWLSLTSALTYIALSEVLSNILKIHDHDHNRCSILSYSFGYWTPSFLHCSQRLYLYLNFIFLMWRALSCQQTLSQALNPTTKIRKKKTTK